MLGPELHHTVEPHLRLLGIKFHRWLAGGGRGWQLDALLQPLDFNFEAVESFIGVTPVHAAQRHDVLACEVDEIIAAHAADSDAGDVQGIARRSESATEDMPRNNGTRGAAGGDFSEEGAARDFFLFAHAQVSKAALSGARGAFAWGCFGLGTGEEGGGRWLEEVKA